MRPHRATDKNLERLNAGFGRWGRLQSGVLYALIDGNGRAKTRTIALYCWDKPPKPYQIHDQGRAAKSIGARPIRREGREWVWGVSS